jgi:mono/diheme cytochrome c family protein
MAVLWQSWAFDCSLLGIGSRNLMRNCPFRGIARIIAVLFALALFPRVSLAAARQGTQVPPDHAAKMQRGLELFKAKVRPVLVAHCLDCHGGKAIKGDLDLSDRKPLSESGVIDGGGTKCRLYALISHAEKPHMPQKKPKLPDTAIADIAAWIDLGAPYDRPLAGGNPDQTAQAQPSHTAEERNFWSLRPLAAARPPQVKSAGWAKTDVDRFIVAKLEAKGIAPNGPADRGVLCRRLYFDVIGLPPHPDDVDAFVNDRDPDAYSKLVDRLLDSPRFGERWARHWMDVARFAESHGYEQDYDRPYAYHYRDFLIRAFNEDMPFDQFLRWQLAGDELAGDDPEAMAATGFLGAGAFPTQLTELEFESARYNELDDMVSTTGSAMLGLSVGCARCHDHKYDPIPSSDYYRLASIFTTCIRSEIDLKPPAGRGAVARAGAKPAALKVQVTAEGFPHTKHHADERGFPHFYPKTFVLARGDVNQKKAEAVPGFLHVLERDGRDERYWKVEPSRGSRTSCRRTALARWITDADYGAGQLAARVIVNRLWQHHFSYGIVATPNDFGAQGERPTHPELLDWLAADLIGHGWTLKRVHRLILNSAVYQEDTRFDAEKAKLDRENLLHWRWTPRRLEAEPIHDAMLAVAGLLDLTMFGPGTLDPNMLRRAVYFQIKRSQLIPMMMLFDWPEHLVSIGQRSTTTTAPQALAFMNSDLGRRCAAGLAARLPVSNPETTVKALYRLAYGRIPTAAETQLAAGFLARQSDHYRGDGKSDPDRLARVDLAQAIMSMSEFIYIP